MSLEVDVYDTLEGNGLILAPHLVNILKELGYNDVHTLEQIQSPESLEKSIRDIFGECENYKALSDEEKKRLLGPRCWKHPSCFKFLPGEEASLNSIKKICSAILEKMPLIYSPPNTSESTPYFSVKNSKQIQHSTCSDNNSSQKKNETVDRKGKSISSHIDDWCKRKALVVKYGPEHYELEAGVRIRCLVCHKSWRYTLGLNGYWKISKFTDHIHVAHKLGTSVGDETRAHLVDLTKTPVNDNSGGCSAGKRRKKTVEELVEEETAERNESDSEMSNNGSKKESSDSESEDKDLSVNKNPGSNNKQPKQIVKSGNTSRLHRFPAESSASVISGRSGLKIMIKKNSNIPRTNKPRCEKRKQAMLRGGASNIYQSYIENHFKILDEISLLSKRTISEQLKETIMEM